MTATSCIGFQVDCQTLLKGGLAVMMGFVLFIGSPLLLLSAVFGRRMGYLVVAVSFFAWMIIWSSIWTFGFFSQGPTPPPPLGRRGSEPAWIPLAAGTHVTQYAYPEFQSYPGEPWKAPGPEPNNELSSSIQSATSSITSFLAEQANASAGITDEFAPNAFKTTDFTVQNIRFASHGKVSLMAAQAFYNGGGPLLTIYGYHDSGSVPRYSWMFLIGSILGFGIHVPFLDRAEKKRKAFLTGGAAPPWYGPA